VVDIGSQSCPLVGCATGGVKPSCSATKKLVSSELGSREIDCDDRSLVACGSIVVKSLCYKPEGRRFETR
jgi:hypothetical protein